MSQSSPPQQRKSALFISLGVKSLDEKGAIVATSQLTTIPLIDLSDGWQQAVGHALAAMLPQLVQQASTAIAPFEPKMKASTAELLEAMARRLRAEAHGNPSVSVRTDKNFEEIRILIERPKQERG